MPRLFSVALLFLLCLFVALLFVARLRAKQKAARKRATYLVAVVGFEPTTNRV